MKTPVAFFVFNRPETTVKVFEAIRLAKPKTLLIVADGPREGYSHEAKNCAEVRDIVRQIDWDCRVYNNYSDINLGCKKRVSSGLNWVFEQVEEAIILEDDCLPDPTFFRFCDENLHHYRTDTRIMSITGNNIIQDQYTDSSSYYFSRYNQIWGWATWRRAWCHYDIHMKAWPTINQKGFLNNWFSSNEAARFWARRFEVAYKNQIDTWDYAWTFTCWVQNGLSIIPNTNLISNIGFGPGATHTNEIDSPLANRPVNSMKFPLCHPNIVIRNYEADKRLESTMFSLNIFSRARRRARNILNI